jgi:hypothetical protein
VKVVDCFYSNTNVLLTVQICYSEAALTTGTTLTTEQQKREHFIIRRTAYQWIIDTDSFSCNVHWNRERLLSVYAMHNGAIFHCHCCSNCSSVRNFSKCEIYHCRYALFGYHEKEWLSLNILHNVIYVVGHEEASCLLFRCLFCDYW